MAKSTGNRSDSKGRSRSGGKGGKVENAPSKTGRPSGRRRGNAPPKGKSK